MIRVEMSSKEPEKVPGTPGGPGGPGGPGLPTSLLLAKRTNTEKHVCVKLLPIKVFAPWKKKTLTYVAGNVLLNVSRSSKRPWRSWRARGPRRASGDRDGACMRLGEVRKSEITLIVNIFSRDVSTLVCIVNTNNAEIVLPLAEPGSPGSPKEINKQQKSLIEIIIQMLLLAGTYVEGLTYKIKEFRFYRTTCECAPLSPGIPGSPGDPGGPGGPGMPCPPL